MLLMGRVDAQSWTEGYASYDGTYSTGNFKRHECGAMACKVHGAQKGIVIGGRGNGDKRRVIIYDFASNRVSLGAKSPLEIHHFQAALWRDSLIVMGMAMTGVFPDEVPVPDIYLYNANQDSWIKYDSIPQARLRGSSQAVIAGDWIYFFNGLTKGHRSGWTNQVDRYNLATKTWEILPDSPCARDHSLAIMTDTMVYIVGGRRSNVGGTGGIHALPQNQTDAYNLISHTWSTLPASANLPISRAGLMGALQPNGLLHDQINIWGGEYANGTHKTGIGLDLETLTWTSLPDLVTTMHGNQIIQTHPDSVFLIAGSISGGNEKDVTTPSYVERMIPATPFAIGSIWDQVEAKDAGQQQIFVSWQIEEAENIPQYQIEFKDQGGPWIPSKSQGAAGREGVQAYETVIEPQWFGSRGYLRIKAMGPDGVVSTSPVVTILREYSFPIYPNPISSQQGLLQLSEKIDHTRLFAMDGRMVGEITNASQWSLPNGLTPGLYLLQLIQHGQISEMTLMVE